MNIFPNFTPYGYRAIQNLGHNTAGFRTTYKAESLRSNHPVIIKHFETVPKNLDDWNALDKMYSEEIQSLQGLTHPSIPYYIESFQMEDRSRCIVLEFKSGNLLADSQSFSPEEIKSIAVSLLDILVYLQERVPPIKHRDIKPENIIIEGVENQLQACLVDFGFARIGDGEARTVSSMVKGTLGFMAPEQRRNQPLTNASDLYGLGATLICLVTGIKSYEIDNLTDNHNHINFKELVPGFSLRFIEWLDKMVQPDPGQRYSDAKTALEALRPLYVRRIPEASLSHSSVKIKATKLGKKSSEIISIVNLVPETILEGWLEVSPHSSDPPCTTEPHNWISFNPSKFSGNSNKVKIVVDTARLMADKTYKREIRLYSNAKQEIEYINVLVKSAPLPVETIKFPYGSLIKLFLLTGCVSWPILLVLAPIISGKPLWYLLYGLFGILLPSVSPSFFAFVVEVGCMLEPVMKLIIKSFGDLIIDLNFGRSLEKDFIVISTVILGSSLSARFVPFFPSKLFIFLSILSISSSLFLLGSVLIPILQRQMAISKYRESEKNLIKPG